MTTADATDFYAAIMTPELAKLIRNWRCHKYGASYRQIAGAAYDWLADKQDQQWHAVWELWGSLPSNQFYGIALCEYAARHFGEDPYAEPWN